MQKADIEKIRGSGEPFLIELLEGTDQSCALVGTSAIDRYLQTALLTAFTHRPVKLVDELFNGPGKPLSTFSGKINLSLALGIITSDLSANLHKIRKVRNLFAHSDVPLQFDADPVKSLCLSLTQSNTAKDLTPRVRFARALLDVSLYLNDEQAKRLARSRRQLQRQLKALDVERAFVSRVLEDLKKGNPVGEADMANFKKSLAKIGIDIDQK